MGWVWIYRPKFCDVLVGYGNIGVDIGVGYGCMVLQAYASIFDLVVR